jgi:hypothetical protein
MIRGWMLLIVVTLVHNPDDLQKGAVTFHPVTALLFPFPSTPLLLAHRSPWRLGPVSFNQIVTNRLVSRTTDLGIRNPLHRI